MATYNRDGAIRYAKKWCKDHNPNYVYYDGTNKNTDCANFVSQCMYEGGALQCGIWLTDASEQGSEDAALLWFISSRNPP